MRQHDVDEPGRPAGPPGPRPSPAARLTWHAGPRSRAGRARDDAGARRVGGRSHRGGDGLDQLLLVRAEQRVEVQVVRDDLGEPVEAGASLGGQHDQPATEQAVAEHRQARVDGRVGTDEQGAAPRVDLARGYDGQHPRCGVERVPQESQRLGRDVDVRVQVDAGEPVAIASAAFRAAHLPGAGRSSTSTPARDAATAAVRSVQPLAATTTWNSPGRASRRTASRQAPMARSSLWAAMTMLVGWRPRSSDRPRPGVSRRRAGLSRAFRAARLVALPRSARLSSRVTSAAQ